jgi:hypothetical protein
MEVVRSLIQIFTDYIEKYLHSKIFRIGLLSLWSLTPGRKGKKDSPPLPQKWSLMHLRILLCSSFWGIWDNKYVMKQCTRNLTTAQRHRNLSSRQKWLRMCCKLTNLARMQCASDRQEINFADWSPWGHAVSVGHAICRGALDGHTTRRQALGRRTVRAVTNYCVRLLFASVLLITSFKLPQTAWKRHEFLRFFLKCYWPATCNRRVWNTVIIFSTFWLWWAYKRQEDISFNKSDAAAPH